MSAGQQGILTSITVGKERVAMGWEEKWKQDESKGKEEKKKRRKTEKKK